MPTPYKSLLTRDQLRQLARDYCVCLNAWLTENFDPFVDTLDEHLFDLAEQAPNDALAQAYMGARKALANNRQEVVAIFHNQVLKAGERFFLHYESYLEEFVHGYSPATSRSDALELVNNEKLEEELVVLRAAHRVAGKLLNPQKRLGFLLAAVVQPQRLSVSNIPVAPIVLCNCFGTALSEWEGALEVKLALYEFFADSLLESLEPLFRKLIALLEEAGLEPVTPPRLRRREVPGFTPRGGGEPSGADDVTLFSVAGLIRQLGEEQRQVLGLHQPVAEGEGVNLVSLGADVLAELVRGLWQKNGPAGNLDGDLNVEQLRDRQAVLKRKLAKELGQVLAEWNARLNSVDQQIIDLVSMLFDYMLDDPLIPPPMKLLLVRLQMPVLQIAIRDKTFLTNRNHAARQLLNNLSRAAVRWGEEQEDTPGSLYGMIENCVEAIRESDVDSSEIYMQVNQQFEAFVAQEERGARVTEERVSQVAKGKEQLAMARRTVQKTLNEILPTQVPEVVYLILTEAWRDVLTLTLLREGQQSLAWNTAIRVAKHLVASGQPQEEPEKRQQMIDEIPVLLAELRQGFNSISYDARKSSVMLKQLQRCHAECLMGREPEMKSLEELAGRRVADEPARKIRVRDAQDLLVNGLKEGQWISWKIGEQPEKRGKLAWRSEMVDLLLFVDLRGHKLAEFGSDELAQLFRRREATLLERIDQPFMERALKSIYATLMEKVHPQAGTLPA